MRKKVKTKMKKLKIIGSSTIEMLISNKKVFHFEKVAIFYYKIISFQEIRCTTQH